MKHRILILHQRATRAGIAKATGGVEFDYDNRASKGQPSRSYTAVVDDEMLAKVKKAKALLRYVESVGKPEKDSKKDSKKEPESPQEPTGASNDPEVGDDPAEDEKVAETGSEGDDDEPTDEGEDQKPARRRRRS